MKTLLFFLCAISIMTGCSTKTDRTAEISEVEEAPATPLNHVSFKVNDESFEFPDTLEAGWTEMTLENTGQAVHVGQLIRLEEGRSLNEFLEEYRKAWETNGPRPEWAPRLGGPSSVMPGGKIGTIIQNLRPGHYIYMDIMYSGESLGVFNGMYKDFVVTGEAGTSEQAPEADVELILGDYFYAFQDTLYLGTNYIRLENQGDQPHETSIFKVYDDTTIDDVIAWMENPSLEGVVDLSSYSGIGAIASGEEAYLKMYLRKGKYALVCYVTAPDGRPHMAHGIYQIVEVF